MTREQEMFNRLMELQSSKYDDQIGIDESEEKERLGLIAYFTELLK